MKLTTLTLASVLFAGAASASTVTGFTLDIRAFGNDPQFTLYNSGNYGDISGFTLSLGADEYNFDAVGGRSRIGTFSFTQGPEIDNNARGGLRTTDFSYSFNDLNAGEAFRFRTDIDEGNADNYVDFVTALLPTGSITVTFAGGLTDSLSVDLATGQDEGPYTYAASVTQPELQPVAAVPLPAGLPLLLAGLGALGIARRKRG